MDGTFVWFFPYLDIGRDEARVVGQQQTKPSPESGELVLRTGVPNLGGRRSKMPAVASFRRQFVRCKQNGMGTLENFRESYGLLNIRKFRRTVWKRFTNCICYSYFKRYILISIIILLINYVIIVTSDQSIREILYSSFPICKIYISRL